MVAMATNSNITVPQKYTAKYKTVGYGWDTSHPTTISKKFIILIYHYLHAVLIRRKALSEPSARARVQSLYARTAKNQGTLKKTATRRVVVKRVRLRGIRR